VSSLALEMDAVQQGGGATKPPTPRLAVVEAVVGEGVLRVWGWGACQRWRLPEEGGKRDGFGGNRLAAAEI
jgi:hypothetical protein